MSPTYDERGEGLQVTASQSLKSALKDVSPARLLMASDFDGTLAEIVPDPGGAQILPEAYAALQQLAQRVLQVAVISGRSTADLERLLPIAGLVRLGDYGLTQTNPDEREALEGFNQEAAELVTGRPWARLEMKPGSSSIHFRQRPEGGEELAQLVLPAARRRGLSAQLGRRVIEVKPERAGKDGALRNLVERLEPDAVIYAGDDTGDEPVFSLLAGFSFPHLGVGVASAEVAPEMFRNCDLVVDGPREFSRFLNELAEWADRSDRVHPGSAS